MQALFTALIEKGKEFVYLLTHGLNGVFYAIITVLVITAWWLIFVKAGEHGWKSLIPFYDAYLFVRFVEGRGMRFLFLFIPLFSIYYYVRLCLKTAYVFDKSKKFGVGLIFFPWLFVIILGFGNAEYKKDKALSQDQ